MPKDKEYNSLDGFSEALKVAAEARRREHELLQTKLGEPFVFVPDQDDPRFGVGYWKADKGVFSYRKYANGYDPYSRNEFTNDFIDLLVRVRDS